LTRETKSLQLIRDPLHRPPALAPQRVTPRRVTLRPTGAADGHAPRIAAIEKPRFRPDKFTCTQTIYRPY
jgi:hypothetical protein